MPLNLLFVSVYLKKGENIHIFVFFDMLCRLFFKNSLLFLVFISLMSILPVCVNAEQGGSDPAVVSQGENKTPGAIADSIVQKHGPFKKTPAYDEYKHYSKNKEWEKALPVIAALFAASDKPEVHVRKGFALALYNLERYQEAVIVLKTVPGTSPNLYYQHLLAQALIKLKRFGEAHEVISREFKKKSSHITMRNLFRDLVYHVENLEAHTLLLENEHYILSFFEDPLDPVLLSLKFKMIYAYKEYSYKLLVEKNYTGALKVMNRLVALEESELGKYAHKIFPARAGEDRIMRDALDYYKKQKAWTKKATFTILVTQFTSIDVTLPDGTIFKNTIEDSEPGKMRQNAEAMKVFYYYATKGKMVISIDFHILESTIYAFVPDKIALKVLIPDHSKTVPDPYDYFQGKKDSYDAFINIIPFVPKATGYFTNFGGKRNPYTGSQKEPVTYQNQQGQARFFMPNWVHELYHSIEKMYGITEQHIYREDKKQLWPSWYDGTSEFSYLLGFFEHNPYRF